MQLEKIERLMNMFEESVIERGRIDELAQAIQNKELIEHLNRLGDISKRYSKCTSKHAYGAD